MAAFTLNWNVSLIYAFPPFSLIAPVLKKIQEDQVEVIMVVPHTTMDSTVMVLTASQHASRQTTSTSTEGEHPLPAIRPGQASSTGVEAQIDGLLVIRSSLKNKDVSKSAQESYSTHGETAHRNNIDHIGESGKNLLVNNLWIPFVIL